MSYVEWLYDQLCEDGFIDANDYDRDELTKTLLISSTELEEDDLANYEEQFIEHCSARGVEPDWDLED